MTDASEQLKKRTIRFALDVCALMRRLPRPEPGPTVRRQLVRSSTALAFNYRASFRARSHAEYTARIGVASGASDESVGWLELIDAARLIRSEDVCRLADEARELSALFSALYNEARRDEETG